VFDNTGR